jgi:hypothetical protein
MEVLRRESTPAFRGTKPDAFKMVDDKSRCKPPKVNAFNVAGKGAKVMFKYIK